MAVNAGNLPVEAAYLGDKPLLSIYLGSQKLWPTVTVNADLLADAASLSFVGAEHVSEIVVTTSESVEALADSVSVVEADQDSEIFASAVELDAEAESVSLVDSDSSWGIAVEVEVEAADSVSFVESDHSWGVLVEAEADSVSLVSFDFVAEHFVEFDAADSVSRVSADVSAVIVSAVGALADSESVVDAEASGLVVPSEIIGTVTVSRPRDVAVVGGKAYVTENNRPGAVHVFRDDDFTQPAIKVIPMDGPYKIGVFGAKLFVTANSGLYVIDTTTDTVVNQIVDAALTDTRFAIPYGNKVYVGDYASRSVVVIDAATESVVKVITGFGVIVEAVIVGSRMFVLNNNGTGWIVDLTTDTRTQIFGTTSHNIGGTNSIGAIGSKILVGGFEPFLDILDGGISSPGVIQVLPIPGTAFAITGDDATAYAALFSSNEVVGVWQKPGTTGDLEPRNTFSGMSGPVAVRIWGRRLYICNNTNGTVVIADIPEGGAVVTPSLSQTVRAWADSRSVASADVFTSGTSTSGSANAEAKSISKVSVTSSGSSGTTDSVGAFADSLSKPSADVKFNIDVSTVAASSVSTPIQGGRLSSVQVDSLVQISVDIPAGVQVIDIVALGAGGGGGQSAGGGISVGGGGGAGKWATRRLTRNTDFTVGPILARAGTGGAGGYATLIAQKGQDGGNSYAAIGVTNVSADGGAGGGAAMFGVSGDGASPGNQSFQEVQYVGGVTVPAGGLGGTGWSSPGGVPGAGANGGRSAAVGVGPAGGVGGNGRVWIRFHETAALTRPAVEEPYVSAPAVGEWEETENGFSPVSI